MRKNTDIVIIIIVFIVSLSFVYYMSTQDTIHVHDVSANVTTSESSSVAKIYFNYTSSVSISDLDSNVTLYDAYDNVVGVDVFNTSRRDTVVAGRDFYYNQIAFTDSNTNPPKKARIVLYDNDTNEIFHELNITFNNSLFQPTQSSNLTDRFLNNRYTVDTTVIKVTNVSGNVNGTDVVLNLTLRDAKEEVVNLDVISYADEGSIVNSQSFEGIIVDKRSKLSINTSTIDGASPIIEVKVYSPENKKLYYDNYMIFKTK